MALKRILILEDDIQGGGEATKTFRFGLDGAEYEIDLNDKNASKMYEALTFYIDRARKVSSGSRRSPGRWRTSSTGVDNRAVRAWAASNAVELSSRGRIPASVIERFRAAGSWPPLPAHSTAGLVIVFNPRSETRSGDCSARV